MKKKNIKNENKEHITDKIIGRPMTMIICVILFVFCVAYMGAHISKKQVQPPDKDYMQRADTLNDVLVYANTTSIEYEYYCRAYNMYDDSDLYDYYTNIRFVDTQKYEHESYIGIINLPSKTTKLSEYINHNTRYTIKTSELHYNFDVQRKSLFRKKINEIMNKSEAEDYDIITYTVLCVSHPKDTNVMTEFQVYDEGFKENRYIHIQYPTVHTGCKIIAEYHPDDIVIFTEFECREYIHDGSRGKIMYLHDGETMTSYIDSMLIKAVQKELQN